MKFGEITRFLTGVVIPVFSLRTEESGGVGEFLDLIKLGEWCVKTGLDIIQILPVNDTGADSSPYSAQSAFALNPIFARLTEIEALKEFKKEILEDREALEKEPRLDYEKMYKYKVGMFRKGYQRAKDKIAKDAVIKGWIEDNPWLKEYCVFCSLKDRHDYIWWLDWTELKEPTESDIKNYWDANIEDVMFHAWMQYCLETQLKQAVSALEGMGLRIKGDIPILINVDSADVWGQRRYFNIEMRAGAPPDMFSHNGQFWGFPCYDWDVLERDNYKWWKDRLKQASKFYHAYRIDHVLGFFRIWQIPQREATGALGFFNPAVYVKKSALLNGGFNEDKIDLFMNPYFHRNLLREVLGSDADRLINKYFKLRFKDNNDLFVFNEVIDSDKTILNLDESTNVKDALIELYHDRILIPVNKKGMEFMPSWYFYETWIFKSLSGEEQGRLRSIIDMNWSPLQQGVWADNGRKLLKMMCQTTDMLVCAEDLGAVPDCVPGVLKELNILGLKIERWCREYGRDGQPYVEPGNYPRLSVCSPSGHDTSTLRGWWEESGWDRYQYHQLLHLDGSVPDFLTTRLAKAIIERNLSSNSLICLFPLTDWLSLYYNLRMENPSDERINTPGTVSTSNWSFRTKDTMEFLSKYNEFNNFLRSIIENRRNRRL